MKAIIKAGVRLIIVFLFMSLPVFLSTGIGQLVLVDRTTFGAGDDNYLTIGIAAIVIATLVAAGALTILWIKTDWLVKVLAGDIDDHKLIINTTNLDLFRVGLKIFGFFLIFNSIPRVLGYLAFEISLPDEAGFISGASYSTISQLVTDGARVLIGLGLVFWERPVKSMLAAVRDLPKPQKLEE